MSPTQYLRGTVVLCSFPFQDKPSERGPHPHFCLVIDTVEDRGEKLVAVCYGTSRLDDALVASQGGAVLSVPSRFIKVKSGFIPGQVMHLVLGHVALIPESWIDTRFSGRLDFIRAESRQADPTRQRLYQSFSAYEPIMQVAAVQAALHRRATGLPGLPPGKQLRKSDK